ncbi:unnamed protein product [Musa acuminata subsp. malaccensis]|uniref:(wild Malaysian banana) hypothetical protein n=1 Tax=Musa acuminata subsp. malaccensis TaxID=214687 RepID=A0A804K5M3_MUSAM|nr:PREDICTED: transcription factor RF2a-like [Musa acuminata subsp. malaccensis]CAG1831280.1 unnamed protein product [Musa acuminata subsp. malaccensis]
MDETGIGPMKQSPGNPFLSVSKQQQQYHVNPNATQAIGPYSNIGAECGKRSGVPPASPCSQLPSLPPRSPPLAVAAQQLPPVARHHSRSRSQPTFFSLDSLPTLICRGDSSSTTSLSDSVSADVSMDDHDVPSSHSPPLPPNNVAAAAAAQERDDLPPRKTHRRSQSDVPSAFFPPSLPVQAATAAPFAGGFLDSAKLTVAGVKLENHWDVGLDADAVSGDDLFNAYMNLDGFDALNSSEDNREDLNSRDSGSKTNAADSSENEADSKAKEHLKGGLKRNAAGDPSQVMAASRHCRSFSMDSFMGKFNLEEEPQKLLPSSGLRARQSSKSNSFDVAPNTFSLEFGNGLFTAAEMKKIMENEKLVEMAMTDPKRVKRILANRHSAARSKERKMRYIAELEHKVQTLQTETTNLSTQLTFLQRDSAGLTNQNHELRFRLQAMDQQAQLRDALNEALTAEVQRLKLAATGLADAHPSKSLNQQASMDPQRYQLQSKLQRAHVPPYQLQKQQDDTVMDSRSEQ